MRPSDKRISERLPGDPDENAIAKITAAIRSGWTKREESRRLRIDHQVARFRVPTISTREIGLPTSFKEKPQSLTPPSPLAGTIARA
jgi:hypothetical protein